MDAGNAKQQVVEKIKNSANVLVTVSASPSVDELSAALALTLMLNKMDKHGTAVFSGVLPPAIQFLEPDKTFENTVDSLRDFIIALDKEKADRLRFKVEDDVVKIFITPYRTTLTESDLTFSQGDFNVELILALGVEKREDLDKAIVAHGRILHDATVVTINAKKDSGSLGSVDWQDDSASSLCEMLMSLSEALQPGLLDQQISTALLTGIVAATERFSNPHTTPRVMTMAAQLMAAGANQQLIASKLQTGPTAPPAADTAADSVSVKNPPAGTEQPPAAEEPSPASANGELKVDHETPEEVTRRRSKAAEVKAEDMAEQAEKELSDQLSVQTAAPAADELKRQLEQEAAAVNSPAVQAAAAPPESATGLPTIGRVKPAWMDPQAEPPTMGGTLNATSEEALESRLREESEDRNRTILDHDSPSSSEEPLQPAPPPAAPLPPAPADQKPADLFKLDFEEAQLPPPAAPLPGEQPAREPTLAELEAAAHSAAASQSLPDQTAAPAEGEETGNLDIARQAVNEALSAASPSEATPSTPPIAPPYMPLPDFSNLPPLPPPVGDSDTSMPPFAAPPPPTSLPPEAPPAPPANNSNDPGQFKIPPAA